MALSLRLIPSHREVCLATDNFFKNRILIDLNIFDSSPLIKIYLIHSPFFQSFESVFVVRNPGVAHIVANSFVPGKRERLSDRKLVNFFFVILKCLR